MNLNILVLLYASRIVYLNFLLKYKNLKLELLYLKITLFLADFDDTFDAQKRFINLNVPSVNSRSSNTIGSSFHYNQPSSIFNPSAENEEVEEDIEDDHMESSKILAPDDRFDPFNLHVPKSSKRFSTSYGSNFSSSSNNFPNVRSFGDSYRRGSPLGDSISNYKMGPQKTTPIEKLKNVFGFFSRPINSGTPCTEVCYLNIFQNTKNPLFF